MNQLASDAAVNESKIVKAKGASGITLVVGKKKHPKPFTCQKSFCLKRAPAWEVAENQRKPLNSVS
jgi:hypothetical protein